MTAAPRWMSPEEMDAMLPESPRHRAEVVEAAMLEEPDWLAADAVHRAPVGANVIPARPEDEQPHWRTLATIADDPPGPLLIGMLEPDGPNLLYTLGGTGKGSTGAWIIRELHAIGMKTMVYDAERRSKEWARRVSGLGVDRGEVVYVEPEDLPRNLLGKPMWEVAPHLGLISKASGSDILFVDSVLPATGKGEESLRPQRIKDPGRLVVKFSSTSERSTRSWLVAVLGHW